MAQRPDELRRLIAKYKSDLASLEEMEEDMSRRIQVMENMIPTVLVWLMWKSSQEKKRTPFPQDETEEEAQRKLAHLETVLVELQEADLVLKEEERILRKRIEELEIYFSKDYIDPFVYKISPGTSEAEDTDKKITDGFENIQELENKGMRYKELLEDSNTDWQETCKGLIKEVDELNVNLKETTENLKASEEQVRRLEEGILQADEKKVKGEEELAKPIKKEKEEEVSKKRLSIDQDKIEDVKPTKEELATVKIEPLEYDSREQVQDQIEPAAIKIKEEYDSEIAKEDVTSPVDALSQWLDRELQSVEDQLIEVTESAREKMLAEEDSEKSVEKDIAPVKDEVVKEEVFVKEENDRGLPKAEEVKDVTDIVTTEEHEVKEEDIDTVKKEEKEMKKEVSVRDKSVSLKIQEKVLEEVEAVTELIKEEKIEESEMIKLEEDIPSTVETFPKEDTTLSGGNIPTEETNQVKDSLPTEKDLPTEEALPKEEITPTDLSAEKSSPVEDAHPTDATSGLAPPDQERTRMFDKSAADSTEAQSITSEPSEVPLPGGVLEKSPSGLDIEKGREVKARPSADSLTTQTLQSKCRVKDHLIKSMADQLRDLAKSNVWSGSRLLDNMSEDPVKTYDFNRTTLAKYLQGEAPQNLAASMQPNDSYSAANPLNVKILRKLDKDSLLIEWGPPPSPQVVGFQIFINGEFMYWVHSAKRNKALLHPLDLSVQLGITVSPINAEGDVVYQSSLVYNP